MGMRWSALLLTLLLGGHAVAATGVCHWPAWEQYQRDYISAEGRVIDPSTPSQITTSEGQSYGLFFALVANDRAMFEKLLQWTENHLASGDLSAHLPAWQWGKKRPQVDDSPWGILDSNSASDADLWIAYNLLEAGRLWQSRRFLTLGTQLLQRIAGEEVAEIPGLGVMLLPGKVGFVHGDRWRLNPSYQPPQLLARFATLNGPWKAMGAVNLRLLKESAPHGFSPDWVIWNQQQGWQADETKPNIGSYDAIRVYLWAAMLAPESEERAALIAHFQPMATLTAQSGAPPEQVDTATGKAQGTGSGGFSAALLPLLAANPAARDIQRQRLHDAAPDHNAYFSASLTLFGQGWDEQRYRFNQQGELLPSWDKQCATSP